MKERFIWVDYLKATLIFLMVLGHSSQQGLIGEVLSSFHMPAFFMVSGFLYHSRDPKKLLKSFVYPFLIFYLLWMTKMQSINYLTEGHLINGYFLKTILGLFSSDLSLNAESSFPGYWFLIVLLLMRVFAGDIKFFSHVNDYKVELTIGIVIVYGLLLLFFPSYTRFLSNIYIFKTVVCLPFFYLGMYFREMGNDKRRRYMSLKSIWLILLFVFSLILSSINGSVNVMLSDYGRSFLFFVINTLPMTLFLVNVYGKITPSQSDSISYVRIDENHTLRNKLTFVVVKISEGTLLILGLHGIIIGFFKMAFQNTLFWHSSLRPLCCACFVMLVCYPLILFSKRYFPMILGK